MIFVLPEHFRFVPKISPSLATHWNVNKPILCRCEPNFYLLIAVISANGVIQYKTYCPKCSDRSGAIAHHKLPDDYKRNAFQIKNDVGFICERCGSENGVENHHWAPRALFADADDWPTSYLCPKCHRFWHKKITPKGKGGYALEDTF
jgi:hypothetical protein